MCEIVKTTEDNKRNKRDAKYTEKQNDVCKNDGVQKMYVVEIVANYGIEYIRCKQHMWEE